MSGNHFSWFSPSSSETSCPPDNFNLTSLLFNHSSNRSHYVRLNHTTTTKISSKSNHLRAHQWGFTQLAFLLLFLIGSFVSWAHGVQSPSNDPSQQCLDCICQASSGCDLRLDFVSKCKQNGRETQTQPKCGPFQIPFSYWVHGGRNGPDFGSCVTYKYCAEKTVRGYVNKFASDCNNDGRIDCTDYAMIHALGPNCRNPRQLTTSRVWNDFKKTKCYKSPPPSVRTSPLVHSASGTPIIVRVPVPIRSNIRSTENGSTRVPILKKSDRKWTTFRYKNYMGGGRSPQFSPLSNSHSFHNHNSDPHYHESDPSSYSTSLLPSPSAPPTIEALNEASDNGFDRDRDYYSFKPKKSFNHRDDQSHRLEPYSILVPDDAEKQLVTPKKNSLHKKPKELRLDQRMSNIPVDVNPAGRIHITASSSFPSNPPSASSNEPKPDDMHHKERGVSYSTAGGHHHHNHPIREEDMPILEMDDHHHDHLHYHHEDISRSPPGPPTSSSSAPQYDRIHEIGLNSQSNPQNNVSVSSFTSNSAYARSTSYSSSSDDEPPKEQAPMGINQDTPPSMVMMAPPSSMLTQTASPVAAMSTVVGTPTPPEIPLTKQCLGCICDANTNCDPNIKCVLNEFCGPYLISQKYWTEAGRIGKDYKNCVFNRTCAEETVQSYMIKNAVDCNGDNYIDCDDYVAIHQLGPKQCQNARTTLSTFYTSNYWNYYQYCYHLSPAARREDTDEGSTFPAASNDRREDVSSPPSVSTRKRTDVPKFAVRAMAPKMKTSTTTTPSPINNDILDISIDCLNCLCEANGCNRSISCDPNNDGPNKMSSCGPFMIDHTHWLDVGQPTYKDAPIGFSRCANDRTCAETVVKRYLAKWSMDCNNDGFIDCLDYAVLHKLGPKYCNSERIYESTYWQKFQNCFGFDAERGFQ